MVRVNVKGSSFKKVHIDIGQKLIKAKIMDWHCKSNNLTCGDSECLLRWVHIESVKLKRCKEEMQFESYFKMISRLGIFIGY